MQGARIKITDPEGQTRSFPFTKAQLSLGRAATNDVVLEQGGVSSDHCVIVRDPMGTFSIADRNSTNGTWIGEQRIHGPTPLEPGVSVTVGSYLVSVEIGGTGALVGRPIRSRGAGAMGMGVRGPLLRKSESERAARRLNDRISRYAKEWDEQDRPGRLLLRRRNLRQAQDFLEASLGTDDPELQLGELEESFVRASIEARERGKILRYAGIGGGALAVIGLLAFGVSRIGGEEDELAEAESGGDTSTDGGDDDSVVELVAGGDEGGQDDTTKKVWIEHVVIPAQSLEEIALRYDIPLPTLARWNGVGETEALEVGRKLRVEVDPLTRPLPSQNFAYRTEKKESWSSLSKRFDVPVAKLRAYNPEVGDELPRKAELSIWIDPKPLQRKANAQIPTFEVREDAVSVGSPNNGSIENAIQFPRNDDLYKRRYPNIMWCGGHMAKHLQWAIASFRYNYEFEGEIVVADMSKKKGGHFPPHKSHQSGRDVDIWLPTLKGVYKKNQLNDRDYRPQSEEADWFALYGFLQALHETGEVHAVFLAYELHDRVYQAAKIMGATDEELDAMIAYPRGEHHRKSLLQHSPGHTHHVHVRFKCSRADKEAGCSNRLAHGPGD
ncbi:LysM domain protein [Plesiocystis pacifica SIR-1]|uniref:LysM domain protein n=1 Tax=Plesiocystis pacifica SIR-1 TaxID=391625 RepID=A6G7X3_9BACT|nr:penicillin-insensitive murein endopeptidase [Plesiocystis pacifica]EDM78066.1 LysM domain protein [Plesiocystis pacifica SIR-1]